MHHQAALTVGGLGALVQSEARGSSLFSRNKEGLLSVPGYWALHLLSAGLGHWLRDGATVAARATVAGGSAVGGREARLSLRPLYGWLAATAGVGLAVDAAATAVAAAVEPVSRRACNAAYVLWMLAFNTQASPHRFRSRGIVLGFTPPELLQWSTGYTLPMPKLFHKCAFGTSLALLKAGLLLNVASHHEINRRLCTLVQVLAALAAVQLLGQQPVPRLLHAVNANMLTIFLAANVLTGLINLSMDTLSVSNWTARGIVACYMMCLCSAASIAYRTKR